MMMKLLLTEFPGDETGVFKISQQALVVSLIPPVGTIVPFGGVSTPAGWLLCDGTEVRIADYLSCIMLYNINLKTKRVTADNLVSRIRL